MDERAPSSPPPYGGIATLLLGGAAAGVYVAAQVAALAGFVSLELARDPALDLGAYAERAAADGAVLAGAALLAAPPGLLVLAALARRRGWGARAYLALDRPSRRTLAACVAAAAAFAAASDALTLALGRELVPPFMKEAVAAADSRLLLLAGFVLAAPLFEECYFRGFLYRGWAASRIGPRGAVGATALYFGLVHLQYDLYGIATAVAIGVLLGEARRRTGSTSAAFAMHAAMNLIATVEASLLG